MLSRAHGEAARHVTMTETEFIALADRTLARIGEALDAALATSDADIDWSLNDGILEVECEDGSKVIVNRHVPNREIWVAARSGGFHFRIDGSAWRDTRNGTELGAEVARLLEEQAGVRIAAPVLSTMSPG
jgi:CyaY protein